ncbi:MAG: T9SS type A sorting domain-containing protein, partial [Syntrophothermus sp.]
PFNPATIISYQVDKSCMVSFRIFNSLGEEVKTVVNEYQAAGRYTLEFNASELPSGVYYYMLQAGGQKAVRKMIHMK